MGEITLQIPEGEHQKLKTLSEQRGISVNQILNEMTTLLLDDFDAETRFKVRARRGNGKTERGLQILAKAMADGSSPSVGAKTERPN
jgi:hypothetical protein